MKFKGFLKLFCCIAVAAVLFSVAVFASETVTISGTVALPNGVTYATDTHFTVMAQINKNYPFEYKGCYVTVSAGKNRANYSLDVENGSYVQLYVISENQNNEFLPTSYYDPRTESMCIGDRDVSFSVNGDMQIALSVIEAVNITGKLTLEDGCVANAGTVCEVKALVNGSEFSTYVELASNAKEYEFGITTPEFDYANDGYILSTTVYGNETNIDRTTYYYCAGANNGITAAKSNATVLYSLTGTELFIPKAPTLSVELDFEDGGFVKSNDGGYIIAAVVAVSEKTGQTYTKYADIYNASTSLKVDIGVSADASDSYTLRFYRADVINTVETNLNISGETLYYTANGVVFDEEDAEAVSLSNSAYKITVPKKIELPIKLNFEEGAYLNGNVECFISVNQRIPGGFKFIYDESVAVSDLSEKNLTFYIPTSYKDYENVGLYIYLNGSGTNLSLDKTWYYSDSGLVKDVNNATYKPLTDLTSGVTLTVPTTPTISGKLILPEGYVDDGKLKEAYLYICETPESLGYAHYEPLTFENGNYEYSFPMPENLNGKYVVSISTWDFGGKIVPGSYDYMVDGEIAYIDTAKGSAKNVNFVLEEGYTLSGDIYLPEELNISNGYLYLFAWLADKGTGSYVDYNLGEGDYSISFEASELKDNKIHFDFVLPKNRKIVLGSGYNHVESQNGEIYDGYLFYVNNDITSPFDDEATVIDMTGDKSGYKFSIAKGTPFDWSASRPSGARGDANMVAYLTDAESGKVINKYNYFRMYSWEDSAEIHITVPSTYLGKEVYVSYDFNSGYNSSIKNVYTDVVYINPDGTFSNTMETATPWVVAEENKVEFTLATETEVKGANTTFNVKDSASLEAINDAKIQITSADKSVEVSLATTKSGRALVDLENGTYSVQVIADGYEIRNFVIEKTDTQCEFNVYLGKSILDVSVNVKEMTYEEIVNAGIDTNATANQQVYNCTAVLEFAPDVRVSVDYICTDSEVLIGDTVHVDNIAVTPVAKGVFLIVHSSTTWLKEMFDVQLVVENLSAVEKVVGSMANLRLPSGLSLAEMKGEPQKANVNIGTIEPGKNADIHWYISGDSEGEYHISGTITGTRTDGVINESMVVPFSTKEPITVLSGSAMKLTVEAEKFATAYQPYRMRFTLQNVSDKSLYNVALNILGYKFCKAYSVEDITYIPQIGEEQSITGDKDNGYLLSKDVFAPGEYVSGVFEVTFGEGIALEYTEYMLKNMFFVTGNGSTAEIPTEIVLVDVLDAHAWDNGTVTVTPTCTGKGEIVYKCTDSGCEETKTFELAALGHDLGAWETEIKAGCETTGKRTRKCSRCDYGETVTVPALGHDWNDGEVTKEPTVDEDGEKTYTCETCGGTKKEPISHILPGDADRDGKVTIRDAARILQYKADWDVEIDLAAANVDGDGQVTIRDAARILQYKAGWDVVLQAN